jgi:hypothetical protein
VNLLEELDKATAPPAAASKVRVLSLGEITVLVARGEITPIERIPEAAVLPRESFPILRGKKGRYGFFGRS